jgi:hypothetical protein
MSGRVRVCTTRIYLQEFKWVIDIYSTVAWLLCLTPCGEKYRAAFLSKSLAEVLSHATNARLL